MALELSVAKEIYGGIKTRRNFNREFGDIQPFEEVLSTELHGVAQEVTNIIGKMFQNVATEDDERRLDEIRNIWFGVAVVAYINEDEEVADKVCQILMDAVFGESSETIKDVAVNEKKKGRHNLGLT